MSWCPQCGAEYREGFSTCSECGVGLSDVPPEEGAGAVGPEWVEVASFANLEEAELAQGFLKQAGIPAEVVDRQMHSQPYGMGLLGEIGLAVPPDSETDARACLTQADKGEAGLPEEGFEEPST
jgi:hypothetical protein